MKKLPVHFLFFIFCHSLFSQTKDAAFWSSVGLEKKLVKKTYVHFNTQFRFNENFSRYKYSAFDVGIDYSINRFMNFTGAYVFNVNRNIDNSIEGRQRFYANITLNYETYNFKFINRNRIQTNLDETNFSDAYQNNGIDYFYRNKTTVRYFLTKKIQPYSAFELYFRVNNFKPWENHYYRTRNFFGFIYRLNKNQKLDFYYMIQQQLRKKQPDNIYVVGIRFAQTIR